MLRLDRLLNISKKLMEAIMTNTKRLVISDISDEHRQTFLNLADAMELSRGQLLVLLMVGSDVVSGGVDAVIPDQQAQAEWHDLMSQRIFNLNHL